MEQVGVGDGLADHPTEWLGFAGINDRQLDFHEPVFEASVVSFWHPS
jgi:hypothetical protein